MKDTRRPLAHKCPCCNRTHTGWTKACWKCKANGYKDDLWFESEHREKAFYEAQKEIRGNEKRLWELGINPDHIFCGLADKILDTTEPLRIMELLDQYEEEKAVVRSGVDSEYTIKEYGE